MSTVDWLNKFIDFLISEIKSPPEKKAVPTPEKASSLREIVVPDTDAQPLLKPLKPETLKGPESKCGCLCCY